MKDLLFVNYLKTLGFSTTQKDVEDSFVYNIQLNETNNQEISIPFYYIKENYKEKLFKVHQRLWNRNQTNFFIVVTNDKTFVFNAKVKPRLHNLDLGKIETYDFGVKNPIFSIHSSFLTKKNKNLFSNIISKESFDTGNFFRFFIAKRKKNREDEVDKDLLLNLIALKKDLEIIESNEKAFNDDKPSITHLLILRCLFLKYLEDRQVFNDKNLSEILNSGNAQLLISEFEKVKKINGDIFKDKVFTVSEIKPFLTKLGKFFSVFDYRSGQGSLFPYRFDEIPIQLLSNVYEAFLKKSEKKSKGIFYTPTFLVNFMLSYSVEPVLETNLNASIFDPSCGSGAFLVESFRQIVKARKAEKSFELKKEILTKQIFGIDIDEKALQIAIFSLYLALLEDIDPVFIQEQIRIKSPILPSLIGKTLIEGNTLVENIFEDKTFDCIVGNPPWGSVNEKDKDGLITRKHIGGKGKKGLNENYQYVADYQMSQAFLVRVKKWSNSATKFAMVVNNSMFLNKDTVLYRKENIAKAYSLDYFFELTALNDILFKKRRIGKVGDEVIEVGATEPCTVLIFGNDSIEENQIKYISPRLTPVSEHLKIIHFSDYDVKEVSQNTFIENDLLWRVLKKGNWEDFKLITSLKNNHAIHEMICSRGFAAKKNAIRVKEKSNFRTLIKSEDFEAFHIFNNNVGEFDWSLDLSRRRDENLYIEDRILVAYRPKRTDNFRLRCVWTDEDMVFRNDILCIKIENIDNYLPYLGIFNSKFVGYFIFFISAQWDGGLKREALRTYDIKSIPFPKMDNSNQRLVEDLNQLVLNIQELKKQEFRTPIINQQIKDLENQIDEVVFDLYGLLDYEKEIIREFYKINVDRRDNPKVNISDLENYTKKFIEVFEFILSEEIGISVSYKISPNLGTILKFDFVPKTSLNDGSSFKPIKADDSLIMSVIQKEQLTGAFYNNRLNETKTKVYSNDSFYIMKSNYFKDWTIRKAIKDANEEIGLIIQNLPK